MIKTIASIIGLILLAEFAVLVTIATFYMVKALVEKSERG